ncbi:MAG: PaREP1 family protein, partial [Caldivirga sp.]|uniref:PaREP1 family protein n=1 Tax=Caldivirga sp. TaxID=2080243 RepID=UPI003D0A79C4
DYDIIVEELYRETNDKLILVNFSMAERLYVNFYRNFMSKEGFEAHREAVLNLVNRLRGNGKYYGIAQ